MIKRAKLLMYKASSVFSVKRFATRTRNKPRMKSRKITDVINAAGRISVISTDVFDTLLLRNRRAERSRIMLGERLFSGKLAQLGRKIDADVLFETRLQAQRLAFRGLDLHGSSGEVQLEDILYRQFTVLGLPHSFIAERLQIELDVEKNSLYGNRHLAQMLRAQRANGKRIVAISDTTLSAAGVSTLIQCFHGSGLIDRVYTSADCGVTKRGGGLFSLVAESEQVSMEQMLHIGDDILADVKAPAKYGIRTYHVPRAVWRKYLREANGGLTETCRFARRRNRAARCVRTYEDATSFGREVFGPIVAQFSILLWLYAVEAERGSTPCLLFCARGGIGIRQAFELTIARLGLPIDLPRANVMISRVVAARSAVLARSDSALEELDREFRGSRFADVAAALGGKKYELTPEWENPFSGNLFRTLLNSRSGAEVIADIERQNSLFVRHFRELISTHDRVILCDTGLYGSTQRLLSSGFPDLPVETVQLARSNYKGHGEEHFSRVSGLLVERNWYTPLDVNSCVLRYWHLIESLFEPALPSVRLFREDENGQVTANCGDVRYGVVDAAAHNPLLFGALSYIDALTAADAALALRDAQIAWGRLKSAIAWPDPIELRCLEVGARSIDFGRSDSVAIFASKKNSSLPRKLKGLRSHLWREGAISREFPTLKFALLPMLEAALSLRGLLALQQ
jgi:FMN phosphatase YigB (HAD superfamily)